MKFCHITPVDHLDLVKGREAHLTLAHIVSGMEGTPEQQKKYCAFYAQEKFTIFLFCSIDVGANIVCDNALQSAFCNC